MIATQNIYWHRELPPVEADPVAEHTVEADSLRVPGTIAHRDELWADCRRDLFDTVRTRLGQEIVRLGGTCAHVLDEHVAEKRDPVSNEAWLHGRFTYTLFR